MVILPPVAEPAEYNENYVLYWNHAGLELNRLTHSLQGPQQGPPISARVLGILQLAIHDAYFGIFTGGYGTYLAAPTDPAYPDPAYHLPDPPKPVAAAGSPEQAADARQAVAGAAVAVLEAFYGIRTSGGYPFDTRDQLNQLLQGFVRRFPGLDALSRGYQFGLDVGTAMLHLLAVKPDEPGVDQGAYQPKDGPYKFRDEPTHPVRLVPVDPTNPTGPKRAARMYHGPFYGMTASRVAVQMTVDGTATGAPTKHMVADPPVGFGTTDTAEYNDAVADVVRMGGAPRLNTTLRRPDQMAGGLFWAYDGANLIGTPPREYNQILRKIAWGRRPDTADPAAEANNADFARLLALANAAMADAGIFCWREKYCFEFWRPLSGVREHDPATGPKYPGQPFADHLAALADPFWLTLGAPATNTNDVPFKPPFPAYPSGHATFGAAAFQVVRLYYRERDKLCWAVDEPDDIAFDFVSDELDGVNRDLSQPYDPSQQITEQPGVVRTRVVRHFCSLWAAMFENAISRIWLGVHWRFDAFAAKDVLVPASPGAGPPYKTEGDGTTAYRNPCDIRYVTTGPRQDSPGGGPFPIGGVPLGIGIANDVFGGKLRPTPPVLQPTGRDKCGLTDPPPPAAAPTAAGAAAAATRIGPRPKSVVPKSTQTNVR